MKQTKNERVKELRNQLNLTQAEVCKHLGITLATLSRIENNGYDLSPKIERSIIEKFGVNQEWFDTGKGKAFPEGKPEILAETSYSSNPYKDVLYKELKDEITYLRNALLSSIGGKGANPNFLKALGRAGVPQKLWGTHSGATIA